MAVHSCRRGEDVPADVAGDAPGDQWAVLYQRLRDRQQNRIVRRVGRVRLIIDDRNWLMNDATATLDGPEVNARFVFRHGGLVPPELDKFVIVGIVSW